MNLFYVEYFAGTVPGVVPVQRRTPHEPVVAIDVNELTSSLDQVTDPHVAQLVPDAPVGGNHVNVSAVAYDLAVADRGRMLVTGEIPTSVLADVDPVEYRLVRHDAPAQSQVQR